MKESRYSKEKVRKLEDIPNVGREIAADFRSMGIQSPEDLKEKSAIKLYEKLCKQTGSRHDPCVLDTFMAAIDYVNGADAKGWWKYTERRKKEYPGV